MPQSKKLQNQIEKKLSALEKLLDKVTEAQTINPDDPETWDSDALYNLVKILKEALALLTDQLLKGQYDEFGQPLTAAGICSLVDEYQAEDN